MLTMLFAVILLCATFLVGELLIKILPQEVWDKLIHFMHFD